MIADFEDDYTDEQMMAECRWLGSLMSDVSLWAMSPYIVQPYSFCSKFHAAIYYAVIDLMFSFRPVTVEAVWSAVSTHPESDAFGEDHILDLMLNAASPKTYGFDLYRVQMRGHERMATAYVSANQVRH